MKTIRVRLEGETPLLMNSPRSMIEGVDPSKVKSKAKRSTDIRSPIEEADKCAYWMKKPMTKGLKKELYIPSEAIYRCLINASSFYKFERKSAKTVLAGAIRIEPLEVPLGVDTYDVDMRTVVIQRARVVKGRPRLDTWAVEFDLKYNENVIAEQDTEIIHRILEEAGQRIGVLDFRPQKSGQFGTFKVTKFEAS